MMTAVLLVRTDSIDPKAAESLLAQRIDLMIDNHQNLDLVDILRSLSMQDPTPKEALGLLFPIPMELCFPEVVELQQVLIFPFVLVDSSSVLQRCLLVMDCLYLVDFVCQTRNLARHYQ
jgi:hypothetical protein